MCSQIGVKRRQNGKPGVGTCQRGFVRPVKGTVKIMIDLNIFFAGPLPVPVVLSEGPTSNRLPFSLLRDSSHREQKDKSGNYLAIL